MRVVVVVGVLVALAAGAASIAGGAAASHEAKRKTAAQNPAFPVWSPDGKQIAFVYRTHQFSPSGRYRIVRTSSTPGGAVHTVLDTWGECCAQMQWPEAGRILINPASRMKTVSVQGGKPKRLLFSECENSYGCQTTGFILSPNRKYAAAATTSDGADPHSSYGIGLVKLRPGREPAVLSSPITAEEAGQVDDAALTFSPDGTQLVFSRASWDGWNEGPAALMAISLAGGGSVPLAQSGIPGASLVPDDATQVQWSRDGSWVAYLEYDYTHGVQSLEVVPTNGAGTPRVLATCGVDALSGFSWSPTSNLIAYDDCGQFMTVRPDGTDSTDLLAGRHLAYVQEYGANAPQWSPDGSRLLFLAQGSNAITHVWTVRADGSHLTRRG